jgi:hypothetical protein
MDSSEPAAEDKIAPPDTAERRAVLVLRIGVAMCFAGWAWQHLYWEVPYARALWDEAAFTFLERLGFSFDEQVGDGSGPGVLEQIGRFIGWLYVLLIAAAVTARRDRKVQLIALGLSSALLCLLAWCKYLTAQRHPAMWIEHGGQFLIPTVLILALICGVRSRATIAVAAAAFIMTFVGHGAYALADVPPGHFLGMIKGVLPVSDSAAHLILRLAGAMDLVICAALLVPMWPVRRAALIYGTVWGLLTALARPVSYMSTDLILWGADQSVHEAVYRAPHVAIPLFLLLAWPLANGATEERENGEDSQADVNASAT